MEPIIGTLAVVDEPDVCAIGIGYNRKFGTDILYRAASGLERAMADVEAEQQYQIYAEAVIDVWDPYKISLENLPFLAWAMGVNFWTDGWSEQTKRAWVARQWEFKSKRGTLAGAKMAVDFAGRDVSPFGYQVKSATTPPQRVFSGASLTKEKREAWLETLPQLRIWRTGSRSTCSPRKSFLSTSYPARPAGPQFCMRYGFLFPSTAYMRTRHRAKWVVGGKETEITVNQFGSYYQLLLSSTHPYAVFCNQPIQRGKHFFMPSTAAEHIIQIQPRPALPWRTMVGPTKTMEPVNSKPDFVVERGVAGPRVYSGLPIVPHGRFYMPSDAWKHQYERYAVNDGSLGPMPRRPAVQFMGVGRYGFPKYTAWLKVSIRSKYPTWAAGHGTMFRKFWKPHDDQPMERVKQAVMASARLSDRIWLDTGPVPRFVADGPPLLADTTEVLAGEP